MTKLYLKVDQVINKYLQSDLRRAEAIKFLILILDNSDDEKERVSSLDALANLGMHSSKYFELLERIMVTDLNEKIRNIAIVLMGQNFPKKALPLMTWVIKYEKSYFTLISIIKILDKIASEESKKLILTKLLHVIDENKEDYSNRYVSMIKRLDIKFGTQNLTHIQLSCILINLLTILNLSRLYPNFYYEIDKQYLTVNELDLSDLELEPKGLPFGWKNNITNISDVIGLVNLKNLKILDLSNNQIEHVNDIVNLQSLEYLNLSNNKIKDISEMKFINQLSKLRTLDLHGNPIVKDLLPKDVKPSLKVISKTYFEEAEEVFEKYFIKN
jgi:Leucine-rich repeat (LRR) protein